MQRSRIGDLACSIICCAKDQPVRKLHQKRFNLNLPTFTDDTDAAVSAEEELMVESTRLAERP